MSIDKNTKRNSALLYIGKRIMEDVMNETNEGYIPNFPRHISRPKVCISHFP